jgi:uncharacterized protein (DUF2147 family)
MKAGIARRRLAVALMLLLSLIGLREAEASPADGTWLFKDLVLDILDCQHLVCGRIIWIGDAARRPAQCGKTIVWGLQAQGRNEWAGGSILDPDDDRTYRLAAALETDGTLHARIFKGVPLLGRTEILKRVALPINGRGAEDTLWLLLLGRSL